VLLEIESGFAFVVPLKAHDPVYRRSVCTSRAGVETGWLRHRVFVRHTNGLLVEPCRAVNSRPPSRAAKFQEYLYPVRLAAYETFLRQAGCPGRSVLP
jgi:hypothetical protein